MYDQLASSCAAINDDPEIRVVVVRGAAGTFAAGTDIRQFVDFSSGEDGVAYERQVAEVMAAMDALRVPAVAVVEGFAVGAGLAIAVHCDLVVATPDAVFGAPVARTLGNCLPPQLVARLYATCGRARTLEMLLTARTIGADEAHDAGIVHAVVEPDALEMHLKSLVDDVVRCAPLTLAAIKEIDRRLARNDAVAADDLFRRCYGSADFREGVSAFLGKRSPIWTGR